MCTFESNFVSVPKMDFFSIIGTCVLSGSGEMGQRLRALAVLSDT